MNARPGPRREFKARMAALAQMPDEERFYTFEVDGAPVRIALPRLQDEIAIRMVRAQTFYAREELDRLRQIVGDGKSIVDVGANIGNHAVYFALMMSPRHLTCYEPNPVANRALHRSLAFNGIETVRVRDIALGASAGRVSISNAPERDLGATQFAPDPAGDMIVGRLDDEELPEVDFIKIDVEGAEPGVIAGGMGLIRRDRPRIMVEAWDADAKARIDALLLAEGYVPEAIDRFNLIYLPRG